MPIDMKPLQFQKHLTEIQHFLQKCIALNMIKCYNAPNGITLNKSESRLLCNDTYLTSNKNDKGLELDATPYILNVLSNPKVLLELANTQAHIIKNTEILSEYLYEESHFPILAENLTLNEIKNDVLIRIDFELLIGFLYDYLQK